jgi:predicted transcriptional regulator
MTDITREQMRDRLGNLEQIRDLLFGQKIREYDGFQENSDLRLQKLESDFSAFQSEVRNQLTQLEDSLSGEIHAAVDSLEKKLTYLNLTSQEQVERLQQELTFIQQEATDQVDVLQKNVTEKTNSLETEIAQNRQTLEANLQDLKDRIFETIDREFSHLKEKKLSRADLAEVLFELCLKVKSPDFAPQLGESGDNGTTAELLLLERAPGEGG